MRGTIDIMRPIDPLRPKTKEDTILIQNKMFLATMENQPLNSSM